MHIIVLACPRKEEPAVIRQAESGKTLAIVGGRPGEEGVAFHAVVVEGHGADGGREGGREGGRKGEKKGWVRTAT
jgi:hypothetical protein